MAICDGKRPFLNKCMSQANAEDASEKVSSVCLGRDGEDRFSQRAIIEIDTNDWSREEIYLATCSQSLSPFDDTIACQQLFRMPQCEYERRLPWPSRCAPRIRPSQK